METVVGNISRGIQQHKNLSDVVLLECCGELTRGVVEGLTDHKCFSKLILKGKIVPPSKTFQMYPTYLIQWIIGVSLSESHISDLDLCFCICHI